MKEPLFEEENSLNCRLTRKQEKKQQEQGARKIAYNWRNNKTKRKKKKVQGRKTQKEKRKHM